MEEIYKTVWKQEAILKFRAKSVSFFNDKKIIIALKSLLELYFYALIIAMFLNLGSEPSNGNTLRLLLVRLWEFSSWV